MPKVGGFRGVSLHKILVDRIEETIKDTSHTSIADFITDCVRSRLDSDKSSRYVAVPKPMIEAIDAIIEEYPQYLFVDRERFVGQAVRELVLRIKLGASPALAVGNGTRQGVEVPEGWKTISIPQDLFDGLVEEWDKNKEVYEIRYGVTSFSGFVAKILHGELEEEK